MENSLILLLSLLTTFVFSQENKRYYSEKELKKIRLITDVADKDVLLYSDEMDFSDFYASPACDTLFAEKKCFFFILEGSPLSFFENNEKLIDPDGCIMWNREADLRNYNIVWLLKNRKLYIKQINPDINKMLAYILLDAKNTEDYEIWEKMGDEYVTIRKARKDLEKFVGRKFDDNGLMEVDWATGKFFILNLQPKNLYQNEARKELHKKLKIYSIELKQGKLVKIRRQRRIEKVIKTEYFRRP